jgi:TIR domain
VRGDAELTQFLRHFSTQTKIFPGGAIEFIDELAARWEEHQAVQAASASAAAAPEPPESEEVAEDAIFVSYASEDAATANALVTALRAAGLPVWLDKAGGLQGGDDYEAKIRMRIETASLFVPLLSPNVLTPQRRFFRLEWAHAIEVAKRGVLTYIVPVRTGDVLPNSPLLPQEIRDLHWLDAQGGVFDETVQRLRTLYREYRLAMRGA